MVDKNEREFTEYILHRQNDANVQNWYIIFQREGENVSPPLGPYTLDEASQMVSDNYRQYNSDGHRVLWGRP